MKKVQLASFLLLVLTLLVMAVNRFAAVLPDWAVRTVGGFSVTSTMRARPWSLKCVSSMVQPPIRFMVRPAPLCPVSAR